LRVFFHAQGKKLILLLSGYDEGERSSKVHQNVQIEQARQHLKHWKEPAKGR
jgi:putative component of toxin-antitoxin plasmid stabilization module